jgi:hypothetical protein
LVGSAPGSHAAARHTVPAGQGVQLPALPGSLQRLHGPLQATAQHTPSRQ